MKKFTTKYILGVISISICAAALLTGCSQKPNTPVTTEEIQVSDSINDVFGFVVIGKTSASDVYAAVPGVHAIKEISNGLILEYTTLEGKYIHITFQGEQLIASAIEEASESIKKETEKRYYTENDFQSITVGESTAWDVYKLAPIESLFAASYGAFCEFPTEDGRCIRIKFLGSDMIVGSIEVVEKS